MSQVLTIDSAQKLVETTSTNCSFRLSLFRENSVNPAFTDEEVEMLLFEYMTAHEAFMDALRSLSRLVRDGKRDAEGQKA